jgi:hypothetical protein
MEMIFCFTDTKVIKSNHFMKLFLFIPNNRMLPGLHYCWFFSKNLTKATSGLRIFGLAPPIGRQRLADGTALKL